MHYKVTIIVTHIVTMLTGGTDVTHAITLCNGVASHCNDCNERVVIDDFYFIELKLFYICNYIKSDVSIQITGALRRRRGRLEPSPPPHKHTHGTLRD